MANMYNIPENVLEIIRMLNKEGFEAYAVGGCVRDLLLGRLPSDWDIATSACPEEVQKIFLKTVDTGLKHGTVTVLLGGEAFEVTTFRIDGTYLDHRRPQQVEFTSSIEDDLGRRDFTVNAMALHPNKGILDPFSGREDIQKRLIRAVRNPDERFKEDALRMLRAVRFCAQLGFSMEPGTLNGIVANTTLIQKISAERIREEITKILLSHHPDLIFLLRDTGLMTFVLPELETCFGTPQNNPHHIYDVGTHIIKSVAYAEKDVILRWAMLLHDIGKPLTRSTDPDGIDHFYHHALQSARMSKKILDRLKFDRRSSDIILELIQHHDRTIVPEPRSVRRAVSRLGEVVFEGILKLKAADAKAQNPNRLDSKLASLQKLKDIYREIKEKKECLDKKDLAVSGSDLMALGFKPGKRIGSVLDHLLEAVIEEPGLNTREQLLDMAKYI